MFPFSQGDDISKRPRLLRDASRDSRGCLESLMDANTIVVHVEQRNHIDMILDLFREGVGKAGKAAHRHPHGEVLPLDMAGGDEQRIGRPENLYFLATIAGGRAVALLRFRIVAKILDELRVVDLICKGINDRIHVEFKTIACELNPARQALRQIADELSGASGVTLPHKPGNRQLGLRIDCYPSPYVARYTLGGDFGRNVLLLGIAEAPDFIDLNLFGLDVPNSEILILSAGGTDFGKQAKDGGCRYASEPHSGANRAAFKQGRDHLGFLLCAQFVHTLTILLPLWYSKRKAHRNGGKVLAFHLGFFGAVLCPANLYSGLAESTSALGSKTLHPAFAADLAAPTPHFGHDLRNHLGVRSLRFFKAPERFFAYPVRVLDRIKSFTSALWHIYFQRAIDFQNAQEGY